MSLGADLRATAHLPLHLPVSAERPRATHCRLCWNEAKRQAGPDEPIVGVYLRIIADPFAPCQTPSVAEIFREFATP